MVTIKKHLLFLIVCFEDYGNRTKRDAFWSDVLWKTDNLRLWFEYDWQGNLREFVNYMKRNLILNKWDDLPDIRKEKTDNYSVNMVVKSSTNFPAFSQIEKDYLSQLMRNVNNIKKRASDISGLSLSTINRKLKEYKIS